MTTDLGFPVPYGLTINDLLSADRRAQGLRNGADHNIRFARALGYMESAVESAIINLRHGSDPSKDLIRSLALTTVVGMSDREYAAFTRYVAAHAELVELAEVEAAS